MLRYLQFCGGGGGSGVGGGSDVCVVVLCAQRVVGDKL